MIPAHAWGAVQHASGGRPMWAQRVGVWVILDRAGDAPEGLHEVPDSALTRELAADPPPDAWAGTAGLLASSLAPVIGEHCALCGDRGDASCTCCGGAGTLSCGTAGCVTPHGCDCNDGLVECGCVPATGEVVKLRGGCYAARWMLALRGLLHAVGADTECRAWVVPLPLRGEDQTSLVLLVAVAGYRYALAPAVPHESNTLIEVTL